MYGQSRILIDDIEGKFKSSFTNSKWEKQTLMIVDDYSSNLAALNVLFSSQYTVILKDNVNRVINVEKLPTRISPLSLT